MAVPVAPRHLKRYKELAFLLLHHWDRKEAQLGELDLSDVGTSSDSRSLADDLEALGPTYVKLGQLLRTRPDLLSPAAYEDLGRLHDRVEELEYKEVRAVVEEELSAKIADLFEEFGERPLGAREPRAGAPRHDARRSPRSGEGPTAKGKSIGHRRSRRAPGRRGVRGQPHRSGTSVWIVFDARRVPGIDLVGARLRELEAQNLEQLRDIVEPYPLVAVPKVVADYSTNRVLTMELVSGTNVGALGPLSLMERDTAALSDELFRAYLDQALLHGFVHSDPHPGNVILTDAGTLALIDLGQVCIIPDDLRERICTNAARSGRR